MTPMINQMTSSAVPMRIATSALTGHHRLRPAPALPVVPAPADRPSHRAHQPQDRADDQQDQADRPENRDLGDQPDDEQDQSKDDHACLLRVTPPRRVRRGTVGRLRTERSHAKRNQPYMAAKPWIARRSSMMVVLGRGGGLTGLDHH